MLTRMIITHTLNAEGQARIYLGGRSSLECWIEPNADAITWRFCMTEAVTGNWLTDDDKRDYAIHILFQLAGALDVSPAELASVPYERIAALHVADPYAGRRVAAPRRRSIAQGYMNTPPNIRRPATDFQPDREPTLDRNRI